jgi:hypothetical protein
MGEDYGFLFQEGDLFRRKTASIDYDYYEEHPDEKEELAEAEELFARTLSRILPRLEILGFTLEAARAEYQAMVAEAAEMSTYSELGASKEDYLSFEEFCSLACRYPLGDLKSGYTQRMQDFGFQSLIPDDLEILSQQRAQLRYIAIQLRKEVFAGYPEVIEPRVIAVVEDLLLEEFPEALDQIEIRTQCH